MLNPASLVGSAVALTPQSDNANVNISSSSQCWQLGNLVHIFVVLQITGSVSATTNLIKGLPQPSNNANGMGYTASGTKSGVATVGTDGKLSQSFTNATSGDYLVCSVDYVV